jgi:hypothetical protein
MRGTGDLPVVNRLNKNRVELIAVACQSANLSPQNNIAPNDKGLKNDG